MIQVDTFHKPTECKHILSAKQELQRKSTSHSSYSLNIGMKVSFTTFVGKKKHAVRFKMNSYDFIYKNNIRSPFPNICLNFCVLFVSLGNATTVVLRSIGPVRFSHLFSNKLLIPHDRT